MALAVGGHSQAGLPSVPDRVQPPRLVRQRRATDDRTRQGVAGSPGADDWTWGRTPGRDPAWRMTPDVASDEGRHNRRSIGQARISRVAAMTRLWPPGGPRRRDAVLACRPRPAWAVLACGSARRPVSGRAGGGRPVVHVVAGSSG